MKRVILSGTDLSISRLSFGTASLHHLPTTAKRQSLLAAAIDYDFRHFDTAPSYGFGIAELELGKFLRTCPGEVTVASKVGLYRPAGSTQGTMAVWLRKVLGRLKPTLSAGVVDWSLARAEKSLTQTLRTLGRDCLDILFLHEPAPELLDADEFYGWLMKQKELGKLRYWGFAGPLERFVPWVRKNHPLAQVLQIGWTSDGLSARILMEAGREPQITYGCLSSARQVGVQLDVSEILKAALARNRSGSVLVSTRNMAHLRELAQSVE